MCFSSDIFSTRSWCIAILCVVLLGVAPLGHALAIHHVFSEIDHDGHKHSDSDLCQWVQQHTHAQLSISPGIVTNNGSLVLRSITEPKRIPENFIFRTCIPRAPPRFSFSTPQQ